MMLEEAPLVDLLKYFNSICGETMSSARGAAAGGTAWLAVTVACGGGSGGSRGIGRRSGALNKSGLSAAGAGLVVVEVCDEDAKVAEMVGVGEIERNRNGAGPTFCKYPGSAQAKLDISRNRAGKTAG
jgi:hypothetical protein